MRWQGVYWWSYLQCTQTYFRGIFAVGTKRKKAESEQRLCNEKHIGDWILVVTSLLTWYQWMKQPTMSKTRVKDSHAAVQWLMCFIASVAPHTGGMTNNTIKRHLVLHICKDILVHGVTDNVISAYTESAHITLAKITSWNTQKPAVLFTKQAAQRCTENLVVSLASANVKNNIKSKDRVLGTCSPVTAPLKTQATGGKSGRHFYLTWARGDEFTVFKWTRTRPCHDLDMAHLPREVTKFLACYCMPHMPNGKAPLHFVRRCEWRPLPRQSLLQWQAVAWFYNGGVGRLWFSISRFHPYICQPSWASDRKDN